MGNSTSNLELDKLLKTIGNNIRNLRGLKKFSQEDLAYSADINLTYLGYIENGKNNVSVGKLLAISNALDCDIAVLFQDFN